MAALRPFIKLQQRKRQPCRSGKAAFRLSLRPDCLPKGVIHAALRDWMASATLHDTATKLSMIRASREVIAVADRSKFNRQVFVHLCDIGDIPKREGL
jgi:hypothetical protein